MMQRKKLNLKKNEPLHKWLDRIAEYYNLGEELREVLGEVSKESYIHGTNDAYQVLKQKK